MDEKKIEGKEKQRLAELLELLGSVRGRHTELVSVLVPAGFNINAVARQLEAEKSTAANIKSKQTRNAVIDALERIIRELKNYKQTPPHGVAIYCGNVSEKEGVQDIQLWVYEPPQPLRVRLYRCDQIFVLDPLQEMLAVRDLYGLLVIDRQQATIGLLEGKQIKVLQKLTSGVPGKIRAGGQCLSPDTLIMKDNGEIIEIKEAHNPLFLLSENFNLEKTESTAIIAKWGNKKELYKVITCYPRCEIKASKEHTFFVRTEVGIEEKPLSEIKEGDYLLMPEKIDIELKDQKIDFKPLVKQNSNLKKVNIPTKMTPQLAKILGYYLGDGSYEIDRLTFFEQRKDVADYYKRLIEDVFELKVTYSFRISKNYHQLRVYSRIITQLFKEIFNERKKTLFGKVPSIILKSSDEVLSSFIGGFFDAEGYASKNRGIALGINNSLIVKQLQFSLLRLGIISSISEYDNKRNPYSNKIRYTLAIDDLESLKKFYNLIKFSSNEKQEKLRKIIEKRSNRNRVRQIVVNGKEVARIIRNAGLNTRQFKCPDFFTNKKQLSKEVFKKRILDRIENTDLKRRLEVFYLSNLIAVKISKIIPIDLEKTQDIETKSHNFIANGIIVHNSSQRFHRVTEGLAKEFFRRVANAMKETFFDMPKLKGILVGGPIPTKEEFLQEGELVTKLKEKIIAIKDIGYVDEHGLELLVEESDEDISQQELIQEKKSLTRFFETLGKKREMVVYGTENVTKALERGAVNTLFLSTELPKRETEYLETLAEKIGANVILISADHPDGEQFYNLTKGAGAILRFALA